MPIDTSEGRLDRFSHGGAIDEFFTYQRPSEITIPKFNRLNEAFKEMARVVLEELPGGYDREKAIEHLQVTRMLSNLAVATHKPWSFPEVEKFREEQGLSPEDKVEVVNDLTLKAT